MHTKAQCAVASELARGRISVKKYESTVAAKEYSTLPTGRRETIGILCMFGVTQDSCVHKAAKVAATPNHSTASHHAYHKPGFCTGVCDSLWIRQRAISEATVA